MRICKGAVSEVSANLGKQERTEDAVRFSVHPKIAEGPPVRQASSSRNDCAPPVVSALSDRATVRTRDAPSLPFPLSSLSLSFGFPLAFPSSLTLFLIGAMPVSIYVSTSSSCALEHGAQDHE